MSTSVVLPTLMNFCRRMSDIRRRMLVPHSDDLQFAPSAFTDRPPLREVRRNLFGPIDHEENAKFLQEEMNKVTSTYNSRWNFDFKEEKPLTEGRYVWEKLTEENVPTFYKKAEVYSVMMCKEKSVDPSMPKEEDRTKLEKSVVQSVLESSAKDSHVSSTTEAEGSSAPSHQEQQTEKPKQLPTKQSVMTDFMKIQRLSPAQKRPAPHDDVHPPLVTAVKRPRTS